MRFRVVPPGLGVCRAAAPWHGFYFVCEHIGGKARLPADTDQLSFHILILDLVSNSSPARRRDDSGMTTYNVFGVTTRPFLCSVNHKRTFLMTERVDRAATAVGNKGWIRWKKIDSLYSRHGLRIVRPFSGMVPAPPPVLLWRRRPGGAIWQVPKLLGSPRSYWFYSNR